MCSCIQVINEGVVKKARKDHECGASLFIRDHVHELSWLKLKFSELREVVRMKNNGWKIKKGDSYIWQFNNNHGDVYLFKANKTIHEICVRHGLYPCD